MSPRDPEAIDYLCHVYFESGYDVTAMLRALFLSEFFRSQRSSYAKIKSPAELVASTLRLSGEFDRPRLEMLERGMQMIYMGQHLTNPPSVEGWHQGTEWIDTGTLTERLNFASEQLGDLTKPGVSGMVDRITEDADGTSMPDDVVQRCLDQLGIVAVSDETRSKLVDSAIRSEPDEAAVNGDSATRTDAVKLLRLAASSPEFQRV